MPKLRTDNFTYSVSLWRAFSGFVLGWLLLTSAASVFSKDEGSVLATLRADHPRILASKEDFIRIRDLTVSDPLAKRWYTNLENRAEAMLAEPVTSYNLRDRVRLLYESREVLDRVLVLGLLDQIKHDPRYITRVWADMQAAANFPDWNPKIFIDVSEMAMAFAIAYDWFYKDWSPEQRRVLEEAIYRHALIPASEAYRRSEWWTRTDTNWAQVCAGGIISSSLAIAEKYPELAEFNIQLSMGLVRRAMLRYGSDGGYAEGPSYWEYGTRYNVIAIAAFESATGRDFELGPASGFDRTGAFPISLTGPTGKTFNFADADESKIDAPALFYLAARYNEPAYARFAAAVNGGTPLDLLWYRPALLSGSASHLPLNVLYETVGVAILRSAWDARALFVAIKGGRNGLAHGHLDLGSFVLEADGVRWGIDLGRDDYNLPGYFERNKRTTYYRCRAEGHNTLVINPSADGGQKEDAYAPISLNDSTATVDLSKAYGRRIFRRISVDSNARCIRVVDAITLDKGIEAWWFFHTQAQIDITEDGRSAILRQEGKKMRVDLLEPSNAKLFVMCAQPLPSSPSPVGQNPNSGVALINYAPGTTLVASGETPIFDKLPVGRPTRKVAIRLANVEKVTVNVRFSPIEGE